MTAPVPGGATRARNELAAQPTREDRAVAAGLMRRARAAEDPDQYDAAVDAIAREISSERAHGVRAALAPAPPPRRLERPMHEPLLPAEFVPDRRGVAPCGATFGTAAGPNDGVTRCGVCGVVHPAQGHSAPVPGGDTRTRLAEAMSVQHGCDTLLSTSGKPCNRCRQSAAALLPVVESIAAERAAEALEQAADDYQDGLGTVAPKVPMTLSQFAPWLRKRADALTPYPCYCLPGPARCDDPDTWCDRAASLRAASRGETQ